MESIKQSMSQMIEMFNKRMERFQAELNQPTASTSNLATEFAEFKSFVLFSSKHLQSQVEYLAKEIDRVETTGRRKMLLLHGIPENNSEDTNTTITKIVHERFKLSTFSKEQISHSRRLGSSSKEKARPILVKFHDVTNRDKLWFAKTVLRGSGITVSEFLTKARHEAFMAARKRFGISKCWSRGGTIVVLAPDGKRHSIVSCSEVDSIPVTNASISAVQVPEASVESKANRPKRTTVKK